MAMAWDESTANSLLLACARGKDPARALVVARSCKRAVVKSEVCARPWRGGRGDSDERADAVCTEAALPAHSLRCQF
jgi:hypothetical protein